MNSSTDRLTVAVRTLAAARARHGYALRTSRQAGVEALRAALEVAKPMLAAEAVPLPEAFLRDDDIRDGDDWKWFDCGRGVLVFDDAVYDRGQCGHDEWETREGWQVWARADGTLVEVFRKDSASRHAPWEHKCRELPRQLGLREAVRRYSAERLLDGLVARFLEAAKEHDAAAETEREKFIRFKTALAALGSP